MGACVKIDDCRCAACSSSIGVTRFLRSHRPFQNPGQSCARSCGNHIQLLSPQAAIRSEIFTDESQAATSTRRVFSGPPTIPSKGRLSTLFKVDRAAGSYEAKRQKNKPAEGRCRSRSHRGSAATRAVCGTRATSMVQAPIETMLASIVPENACLRLWTLHLRLRASLLAVVRAHTPGRTRQD